MKNKSLNLNQKEILELEEAISNGLQPMKISNSLHILEHQYKLKNKVICIYMPLSSLENKSTYSYEYFNPPVDMKVLVENFAKNFPKEHEAMVNRMKKFYNGNR